MNINAETTKTIMQDSMTYLIKNVFIFCVFYVVQSIIKLFISKSYFC